jgi:hypothetical protein
VTRNITRPGLLWATLWRLKTAAAGNLRRQSGVASRSIKDTLIKRQSLTFNLVAYSVLCFAAVQLILQMSLLAGGAEYIASSLTIDDTYYYLQTAWNTKLLGFVTFDGLHSTNGVQFLWFVIILCLAWLVKTKIALLLSTLAVGILLNALCHLCILKIAAILKWPLLALFMSSLWALQSLPFRIYSTGMENSLHALVFWCVVWQSIVFLIRVRNRETPNFLGLTGVLILNAWTRLDSALLSTSVYAFCMAMLAYAHRQNFRLFLRVHARAIAGSGLLAGFGLIAELAAFYLMGGSFLPVSALVKTSGTGRGLSLAAVNKLVEVFVQGMPVILQGRLPDLALVLIGIIGIVLIIWAQVGRSNRSQEMAALLHLWVCLLIGELLYYIYIAVSGVEYRPYFIWYRSPSHIFWIITGSLIAVLSNDYFHFARLLPRVSRWAAAGFSLFIFVVAVYMFARGISFTSKLYSARYHAALWISGHSPSHTVFASWNAGQLGFFSNRTFINLDGVINNVDYYERVMRGRVSLADYLIENHVDYVVDYTTYESLPTFSVVRTFPLDDGSSRSIQIWQISPQIAIVP